jgi:hypothetical protein
MKIRKLSVILLYLFLGMQLHNAVWAMPMDNIHCVDSQTSSNDSQTSCNDSQESMDHSTDHAMESCELCFTTCQASLITNTLSLFKNSTSFRLAVQLSDTPMDAYLSNNYRPPIII